MAGVAGLIEGFRARSGEASFLDRLDDLRGRLIGSLIAVVLATGVGFYLVVTYDVLGIVAAPIDPFLGGGKLRYLSPTDPFFLTLKLAVGVGILFALPYLIAQAWGLLSPLMRPEERRLALPAVTAGVVLFPLGAVFCYLLVLPLMLQFTMGFQPESLQQTIIAREYLAVVMRLMIAFGLAFELPVAVLVATLIGVVTPDFLAAKRRHAIAIVTVASAIVTPPDPSSLILLAVPVCILYEISIIASRAVLARRSTPLPLGG